MGSGILKRESVVFEGKDFRSRGNNGGVFEMNQDPLSSEENDCREPQRDNTRIQMRHLLPSGATHGRKRNYCRPLPPQENFPSVFFQPGRFPTLATSSTILPARSQTRLLL